MAAKTNALAPRDEKRAPTRKMTVVARDPGLKRKNRKNIVMATIEIPAEVLEPGPIGYRVQIVDYDGAKQEYIDSHVLPDSLDNEPKKWRDGDPSILNDPKFHAQNTYALVMKTLARFEFALGRRIPWSFDTHQLKVAPHGMADANAFYNPAIEGLVFGYFEGNSGGRVQTCLSHDIVVHETTHALLDALRERYMDPSSPDQAAFHEGFADVIALLSVFSQPEIVKHLLLKGKETGDREEYVSRADMEFKALRHSALFALAEEMGSELDGVRGKPLRASATIEPSRTLQNEAEYLEPHRRGELFVAAVMLGFIEIWSDRVLRSGARRAEEFPVSRVAEEGADIADKLVTMWIRAIDYMPPVHLLFGDALTAALTADFEMRPDDSRYKLRQHMVASFDKFGFHPNNRTSDGRWDEPPKKLDYDRVRFESLRSDEDEVFKFIWENQKRLKLTKGAYTKVLSVRPVIRFGVDGFVLRETVAQYYQVARFTLDELIQRKVKVPPEYLESLAKLEAGPADSAEPVNGKSAPHGHATVDAGKSELSEPEVVSASAGGDPPGAKEITTALYGGGVLIFDEYGHVKFWIYNDLLGTRQKARLKYLWEQGQLKPSITQVRTASSRISEIHRLRALDARETFQTERW
jgi:hypothetical protein